MLKPWAPGFWPFWPTLTVWPREVRAGKEAFCCKDHAGQRLSALASCWAFLTLGLISLSPAQSHKAAAAEEMSDAVGPQGTQRPHVAKKPSRIVPAWPSSWQGEDELGK